MAEVAVFLSNPGHHAAMLAPVVDYLDERGVTSRVHSLCEFRGFESPRASFAKPGTAVLAAWPALLRRRPGRSRGSTGSPTGISWRRRLARLVAWHGVLRPRLERQLDPATRLAVLPNDSAFPYDRIVSLLRRRGIPFVLVQEGIRFPLPAETESRYGLNGAQALAVWGEASAEHFRSAGVEPNRIRITGSPRFDDRSAATWPSSNDAVRAKLEVLLITNPIDAQGFCTSAEKRALVANVIRNLRRGLDSEAVGLTIRPHPGEGVEEYRQALAPSDRDLVAFSPGGALEDDLRRSDVAVVMASTVGLEALLHGVPLAVLPTPGHGFVHDYVERGAAFGLALDDSLADQLRELRAPSTAYRHAVDEYLESHLASVGRATRSVGELMITLLRHE